MAASVVRGNEKNAQIRTPYSGKNWKWKPSRLHLKSDERVLLGPAPFLFFRLRRGEAFSEPTIVQVSTQTLPVPSSQCFGAPLVQFPSLSSQWAK